MLENFFPLSQRNGDCAKIWSRRAPRPSGSCFSEPPRPSSEEGAVLRAGRPYVTPPCRLWASTIGWPSGATGRVIISDEGSRGCPPGGRPAGRGCARGMLKPIVWWPAVTTARRRTPQCARSRPFIGAYRAFLGDNGPHARHPPEPLPPAPGRLAHRRWCLSSTTRAPTSWQTTARHPCRQDRRDAPVLGGDEYDKKERKLKQWQTKSPFSPRPNEIVIRSVGQMSGQLDSKVRSFSQRHR
jgi:hypothetical protein